MFEFAELNHDIGKAEQYRRFKEREKVAFNRFKITPASRC